MHSAAQQCLGLERGGIQQIEDVIPRALPQTSWFSVFATHYNGFCSQISYARMKRALSAT